MNPNPLSLKHVARTCRGSPDSEWWDVPLDWDLLHVQDQRSRWNKEQASLIELWWANERHFLINFLTLTSQTSIYFLTPIPQDAYAVNCCDDDLQAKQTSRISQLLKKANGANLSNIDFLNNLNQMISERVHYLTESIDSIKDKARATALKSESFLSVYVQMPLADHAPAQRYACHTEAFHSNFPTPKEMALVFHKLEAREQQLKLREDQQQSSSVGNGGKDAMDRMLQCLKDSLDQKDKVIADMTYEREFQQEKFIQLHSRNAVLEDRLAQNSITITSIEDQKGLLQQICMQLRCEKATLEERCDQNSRTIVQLEQENKSLKGELADMRLCWVPRPIPAQSNEDSNLIDVLSERRKVDVEVYDISSERSAQKSWDWLSVTSSHSLISVASGSGPHCFVAGSVFKSVSGETEHYLKVEQMMRGSQVLSHKGTKLEVVKNPKRAETDRLIELKTESATLHVTPEHRVPVVGGISGSHNMQAKDVKIVQAKDVKVGDHVFEDGIPKSLVSVEPIELKEEVPVWEVTFQPDMPVPVFMVPLAISSKGHGKKHLRRGGMTRRGKPGASNDDAHCSIPDTAEGDSELPDVCKSYHEPQ